MSEARRILRWADPDRTQRETATFVSQFAECAGELVAKLDEWAVIFEGSEADAQKLAASIRSGKQPFRHTAEHKFEVKTRSQKTNQTAPRVHAVYVRCVAGYGAKP